MLAVDAPRTFDVAAARLLAGKRDTAASLADALGALAAFAGRADLRDGLVLALGRAGATHVVLEPSGTATVLRLDGHTWRFERDDSGAVTGMKRDGVPVAMTMLATAHVALTEGRVWTGGGLAFTRLAGAPRVAIAAGPRVRVLGSGVLDVVTAPAPGPDLIVEADLEIKGGPAGLVVRAQPTTRGFQGLSLLVVPGQPAHVVLLVADGSGTETAMGPAMEVAAAPTQHVRLALRGDSLNASIGAADLSTSLPDVLSRGDVGLRAYPDATLDVTGWRVTAFRGR